MQEYYLKNKKDILRKNKQHYNDNKKNILEKQKKYYQENKEKVYESNKKWKEKNKDYLKKWYQEYKKYNRENLTDVYIRGILTSDGDLKSKDIPQILIDAKRNFIKLKQVVKGNDKYEK